MVAEQVGRYFLEEVIGVGSFATVHRAKDERLDDTVVVKVLAENHSLNPEIRERFIAEGRNLRRVSSPHVVTVHDLGESERQQPYLVLEHADRGTLAHRVDVLRRDGWTASAEDTLVIARSLAGALEAVHAAHLVHRDLSPANVLITSTTAALWAGHVSSLVGSDEQILLADLGMCKDLALNSGLTVAGGTSGFRPPEQHTTAVIDARADLWAASSLIAWVSEGATLPGELSTALQRSLAEDPHERHHDVASWLQDVEAALVPPPPPVPGPTRESYVTTAAMPRRSRRTRVGAAGVALVLVGALCGGLVVRETMEPDAATSVGRIGIEGPTQIKVGESATFTVQETGVGSWVWVLPGGAYASDVRSVTLAPTDAGQAELRLLARDDDGGDLQVTLDVDVLP